MNTYVLLGRTGDLCAVLPFLKKEDGCRLVVSNQHSSLLEGVSYVDCVPFDGGVHMLKEAYEWTKSKFSAVKSLQVIGDAGVVLEATYKPSNAQRAMASSFVKEMWRVAGKLDKWDECWPLVFDRRSPEREAKLLADNGFARKGKFKKLILVADEGHSSPFNRKPLLWELIQGRFGKQYQVMRLPKAERFYDLLAIYERAVMLVSIDSAPLHLARACPKLPVVALTRDEPLLWNGTPWMPQHVFYCRYSDFTDRAVEMLDTMEHRLKFAHLQDSVCVWNACDGGVAKVEDFDTLPLTVGITGRDSSQSVKDTKRYPFLRESIRMALQRCPNGRVCLTRPGVVSGTLPAGPCYAYRMEKTFVPVVDLFCAPSATWRSIFHDIPDLILGRDHNWGNALWAMFKKLGAQDVTGVCHKEKEQEVKQELDAPRLQHNQKLTTTFLIKSRVYSRYPKVSEQVQCLPLDRKALRPYGYNPSIVDYNGMTLLAYRFHEGTLSTKLGLAQITEEGKVISHRVMNIAGTSVEDPRFFHCGDQLCVSWVDSNWPSKDPKSVVRYGTLRDGTAMDFQRPEIPHNNGATTAKNYVLFEHDEALYCIHEPEAYTVEIGKSSVLPRAVNKTWSYGEIRGGTIPVEYEGKLLRFFHSSLDNERVGPHPRRYFVGAYLMEKDPPFDIVKVSTKPIIYGSEVDDIPSKDRTGIIQYKTNVVFPAGVLVRDGHWVVSVGVNDSACTLCKITPKELNL